MIEELQIRTQQAAIRLMVVVAVVMVLGIVLAVMIRKEQSLISLKASHRTIVANLPRMVEDTRLMRDQVANFRRLMPAAAGGRSTELLVFSRLDQIKSALGAGTMTVSPPEKKEGLSVNFSVKLPLQNYASAINALGRLQTETFPFVVVTKVTVDGAASGQLVIDGTVIMPLAAGGAQ